MTEKNRTIPAILRADEDVLRKLWEYTEKYTLLVNELLIEIPKHEKFEKWKQSGTISEEAVKDQVLPSLRSNLCFAKLPSRLYVSAVLMTVQTYKSWLAQCSMWSWQLSGHQKWFNVVSSGSKLASKTSFSFEQVQARAHDVLQQMQEAILAFQELNPPKQTSKSQDKEVIEKSSLMRNLLDSYEKVDDSLTKLAMVHLLLNGLQVSDEEQPPEKVTKKLESKKVTIERLAKRLKKQQLPKGRDPLGERFSQEIDLAITAPLPRNDAPQEFKAEFDQWLDQTQIRLFNSAHYPVLFESQDDLIWSLKSVEKPAPEEVTQPHLSSETKTTSPKRRRSKKRRRKIPETRICVRFHTMRNLVFEVYCDRRHLHYFEQFLSDYKAYLSKDEVFSAGLFLFRSATVFWVQNDALSRKLKRYQRRQNESDKNLPEIPPWKTHQLYLHIAIDDRQLSAEGTEQVRQEKLEKYKEQLQRSKAKLSRLKKLHGEAEKQRPLTESKSVKKQQSSIKRTQTTIERLTKTTTKRPSKPIYQGQKNRVMGISFDLKDPVTIAVIDALNPSTQFHCTIEELLIYHRARVKAVNRNVRPFKLKRRKILSADLMYKFSRFLEAKKASNFLLWMQNRFEKTGHAIIWLEFQYQFLRFFPFIANFPVLLLLNLNAANVMSDYLAVVKLHKQHEEKTLKRAKEQKLKRRYRKDSTESNAQEYLSRVISAAIVELAIELEVGIIVIPDLKGIQEKVEVQIRAEARQKHPNNYGAQNNYQKKIRDSYHRWNYNQLSIFLEERAMKDGVEMGIGQQPFRGTLSEKAMRMATEFHSKHMS